VEDEMDLNQYASLAHWNGLVRAHLPELTLILTAALVALFDRYTRRAISKITSSINAVARFAIFLVMCSLGYAVLALGLSWALRAGLALFGGAYMAPMVAGMVLLMAIEAHRQRQT
jgi:hypothetical protein